MSGFFSKILGGGKENAKESTKSRPIPGGILKQALQVLEAWEKGLGERASDFFMSGEDRPVLLAIEAARKNQSNLDYKFVQDAKFATFVLANMLGGHPEKLARLAEIGLAEHDTPSLRYRYAKNTKLDMPAAILSLMDLLSNSFHYRAHMKRERYNLTATDILEATGFLGGSGAHLVTYEMGAHHYQNSVRIGETYLYEHLLQILPAEEIIAGLQAIDAARRADAIETLASKAPARVAEMSDYLFQELGATSAKLREAARKTILQHLSHGEIEPLVIEKLSAGKAALRSEAAILAGEIGTPACLEALKARKEVEKTAAILGIIEQYMQTSAPGPDAEIPEGSYLAADGSLVEIPPFVALQDDNAPALDEEDRKALIALREDLDRKSLERYREAQVRAKEQGRKVYGWEEHTPISKKMDLVFDWFNTGILPKGLDPTSRDGGAKHFVNRSWPWISARFDKLPMKRRILAVVSFTDNFRTLLFFFARSKYYDLLEEAVESGEIDARHIIDELRKFALKVREDYGLDRQSESPDMSDAKLIEDNLDSYSTPSLPGRALFGLYAENLEILIDALPPKTSAAQRNTRALEALATFPKLPADAVQSVLFCAISERRYLRELAQPLLKGVDGINARLIEVLDDKRQDVRGQAARFLADRGAKESIPALVKRLKKEKSESARAHMISAISIMGGDTSPYLGQKPLLAEAEKLSAKLPGAKMEWLPVDQAPALRWKGGAPTPPHLLDAWLKLAIKLKDPAGSPLFGLYLDQLEPADVTAFADWLLAAWIAYDTYSGNMDEIRKKCRAEAISFKKSHSGSNNYYDRMSEDELTELFIRNYSSSYLNSGSDSKGLLALAHRGTGPLLAQRVQAYLKNHGRRVSQAKCLVQLLGAIGSPEALQVLVATATRFKQRTVRELAEELVAQIAAERGWSEDELADRSVPTGGFEDDGSMELPVGEEQKLYIARLGEDLAVKLFNPSGKMVKALPTGKDEATKASKALLSAAKKTVKTATSQQADRLYGAMVAERRWSLSDWQTDILGHPILRRLAERVIWLGLDAEGAIATSLRPTPEGDMIGSDGDDADLGTVSAIGIAHTSHMNEEARQEWLQHFEDFEVTPLFMQIARPMQLLSDKDKEATALVDRKGWLMDTFALRGASAKAGFERGPVEDGAGFNTYIKPFRSAGMTAVLEFTGSYVPEEQLPAAIICIEFRKGEGAYGKTVKLADVPPILLSEVWADLHQIAKSGAYDAEWQKKGLY